MPAESYRTTRPDELSHDEIRAYLKPHTSWLSVLAPMLAIATVAGGWVWWAARTPDPARVEKIQNDIVDIRLNAATTQRDVQGLREDVSSIKVDLRQLLMQRRK